MMRSMKEYVGNIAEAPIPKHQIPNNIQIPFLNDPNGVISDFGDWVIGNYLEFGIWILEFDQGFTHG